MSGRIVGQASAHGPSLVTNLPRGASLALGQLYALKKPPIFILSYRFPVRAAIDRISNKDVAHARFKVSIRSKDVRFGID